MRVGGALSGLLLLGLLAGACSSGGDPASSESVKSTAEAITNACDINTIGLPCDPDGGGASTECQGICALNGAGSAVCMGLAEAGISNVDGRVCGNVGGIGNAACARHCQGVSCLATPAAAGVACRPNSKSDPCDGQCDGAGTCKAIGKPCDFGREGQGCTFDTCNFLNATSCQIQTVKGTCQTGNLCTVGLCSSLRTCVPVWGVGCNDGNSCTDDSCDAQTGGCIGTPNDANTCSDNNACTVGDFCASGVCKSGTVPLNCDDNDPCTVDTCNAKTGCIHLPKCSDGNACTAEACDPASGQCGSSSVINCDDNDPCTVDTCNTQTGCVNTPKDCNDNDACTKDTCSEGQCAHATVTCSDGDPCTTDTCSSASGCVFTLVSDCGFGTTGGTSGSGGASGSGGGGGSGTAGVSAGGEAGVSTGGTDASGGIGDSGSPGAAGSPVIDMGGSPDAGGSSSTIGEAGAGNTTSLASSKDSGSCGCRTVGNDSTQGSAALVFAALGLVALRRRRQRQTA